MADAVNQSYVVLEEMVRCAQAGDRRGVARLHERLNPSKLYARMTEEVAGDYDNCRQSCTLGGTFLMPDAEQALKDAKERFARIPKTL
jgi:hypothetical protein